MEIGDWRSMLIRSKILEIGDWRSQSPVLVTEQKKWRLEIDSGDWRLEIGVEIGDWRLQIGPLLGFKDMASSTVDGVSPSFRSGRCNVHALVAPQTKNITQ